MNLESMNIIYASSVSQVNCISNQHLRNNSYAVKTTVVTLRRQEGCHIYKGPPGLHWVVIGWLREGLSADPAHLGLPGYKSWFRRTTNFHFTRHQPSSNNKFSYLSKLLVWTPSLSHTLSQFVTSCQSFYFFLRK